jgi:hypothetical protein
MKNTTFTEKFFYLAIFAIAIYSVAYSYIDVEAFNKGFGSENGPLIWLAVTGFLFGAFVAFYRSYLLVPFRAKRFRFGLIIIGCLFVLGALEELSWGQHIFGFESPEFFQKYNAEGKTNFRELQFYGAKINKIIFGTLFLVAATLYVFGLPVIYKKYEKAKNIINSLAFPVPRNFHMICYGLILVLAIIYQGQDRRMILEFGGSWMFYLISLNPENREFFSRKTIR